MSDKYVYFRDNLTVDYVNVLCDIYSQSSLLMIAKSIIRYNIMITYSHERVCVVLYYYIYTVTVIYCYQC